MLSLSRDVLFTKLATSFEDIPEQEIDAVTIKFKEIIAKPLASAKDVVSKNFKLKKLKKEIVNPSLQRHFDTLFHIFSACHSFNNIVEIRQACSSLQKKEVEAATLASTLDADNAEELASLIIQKSVDLEIEADLGSWLLIQSIKDGKLRITKLLIEFGVDVNRPDQYGEPPLFHACLEKRNEWIQSLIDAGANILSKNNDHWDSICAALEAGNVEALKILSDNLKARGESIPPLLEKLYRRASVLSKIGWMKTIDQFTSENEIQIDINSFDDDDKTALMRGAQVGNINVLKKLLAVGAQVNLANRWGSTALMYASALGRIEYMGALIQAGADVSVVDRSGRSARSYAEANGFLDCVQILKDAEEKEYILERAQLVAAFP